jgi:hypothetical protein
MVRQRSSKRRSLRVDLGAVSVIAVAAALLLGCSSKEEVVIPPASAEQVTLINSAQGRALIESPEKVLVIDVRPRGEYMSGHLVGAQSIDAAVPADWEFRTAELDKDIPTVVHLGGAPLLARLASRFSTYCLSSNLNMACVIVSNVISLDASATYQCGSR